MRASRQTWGGGGEKPAVADVRDHNLGEELPDGWGNGVFLQHAVFLQTIVEAVGHRSDK